jgi:hypothetical protein
MSRRTVPEVPIPQDLQLLNSQRVAAALDLSLTAVYELWNRRELPYVTVMGSNERVTRCTSLADLRKFIERRRTAALNDR